MANCRELHVRLPDELVQFVEERGRTGRGSSPEEVVQDALELLRNQDSYPPLDLERVRTQVAEGLEQAQRGEVVDGESVFDALEARLG